MFGNGPRWENSPRKGSEASKGNGARSTAVRQPIAVSIHQHRTGLSARSSFSLEFQQVAIDLVVYIGVVFLLTQV